VEVFWGPQQRRSVRPLLLHRDDYCQTVPHSTDKRR
jgi:hypothetical protein